MNSSASPKASISKQNSALPWMLFIFFFIRQKVFWGKEFVPWICSMIMALNYFTAQVKSEIYPFPLRLPK